MKKKDKVFLLLVFGSAVLSATTILNLSRIPPLVLSLPKENDLRVFLVGDIMLDRGVEWKVEASGGEYVFPFEKVDEYLRKMDITFGNLESVISDKGKKVGSRYSFRADPKAADGLAQAGFDVVSVANNHSLDYGSEALMDSVKRLESSGIKVTGAGFFERAYSPVIVEKRGTKVGFLSYTAVGSSRWAATDEVYGIAWLDEDFEDHIREAEKKVDVLIVSLHFGEEYEKRPSRIDRSLAQDVIDAGADLVVGHHPHVVGPVHRYGQGHIAFSLGNFVFDQNFSSETMEGLALEIEIRDGKVKNVIPHQVLLNDNFQPEVRGAK